MDYTARSIPSRISSALTEFLTECDDYQLRRPQKLFHEFLLRIEALDLPLVDLSGAAFDWFAREVRAARARSSPGR